MTEKKTFKNPELDYCVIDDDWREPKWGWIINDEEYRESEWEIEVTLIKKAKPLEVGDEVATQKDIRGTIRAIWSYYCWIEYPNGGLGTYALNETRRVAEV